MNPAYPSDFIGKLELFEYVEKPNGFREEHWLSDSAFIKCIWLPLNNSVVPSTIIHKYF